MRTRLLATLLVAGSVAAPASADLIYNCYDMYGVGAYDPAGVVVYDDLHVAGGGMLTEVHLGLNYGGLGGGTADVSITLYLDDGNGTFGPEDTFLLNMTLFGEAVGGPFNPNTMHVFDVSTYGITVVDDDLIWGGGVASGDPNARLQLQLPYPMVGTTDSHLYTETGQQIPGGGVALTFKIFAEPVQSCPADINGDGLVDVQDLLSLFAAWGQSGVPEDINLDGIVDVQDLLELFAAWGPCE